MGRGWRERRIIHREREDYGESIIGEKGIIHWDREKYGEIDMWREG